jgi:hypothetical protein
MPKTGADHATLQCLLGTTRPQAGVLPWVDYTIELNARSRSVWLTLPDLQTEYYL